MPFAIERGVTVTATPARALRRSTRSTSASTTSSTTPERADGWRAFARGMVAELRAAGFDVAPAHLEITGDLPRGSGLSSSAALEAALALALLGRQPPEDLQRAGQALLARRERLGRRRDRPAGPVRLAAARAPATCCGSTSASSTSSRTRSTSATGSWSRSTPARRTRSPPPATTSAAPSAARPARRSGIDSLRDADDLGGARRHPAQARPPRGQRERARGRHGGGARRPRPRARSPSCWTPRTPRCATTTRRPSPRSRPPSSG